MESRHGAVETYRNREEEGVDGTAAAPDVVVVAPADRVLAADLARAERSGNGGGGHASAHAVVEDRYTLLPFSQASPAVESLSCEPLFALRIVQAGLTPCAGPGGPGGAKLTGPRSSTDAYLSTSPKHRGTPRGKDPRSLRPRPSAEQRASFRSYGPAGPAISGQASSTFLPLSTCPVARSTRVAAVTL